MLFLNYILPSDITIFFNLSVVTLLFINVINDIYIVLIEILSASIVKLPNYLFSFSITKSPLIIFKLLPSNSDISKVLPGDARDIVTPISPRDVNFTFYKSVKSTLLLYVEVFPHTKFAKLIASHYYN